MLDVSPPSLGGPPADVTDPPGPYPSQPNAPHAVVIGSGFGGLAAAVRLGARGYRVTVLEKLDQPGGRAYVHRQNGFTFDAGPTMITAPFLFEELWALAGRRFQDDMALAAMDPFYVIRFADGSSFRYTGDPEAMEAEIARFAPGDVEGYRRFMKESERIFRIGFEKFGHVPFGSVADMLRVAPELVRLGGHRSVWGLVSRYIKDERLRIVFSFHPLLIGGNPFSVTSVYCLIAFLERKWGVHFAMGGTGRLVTGLVDLIRHQGGTVRLNAPVEEILLEGRTAVGVRLASGERIPAAIVVSNADPAWTYRHMLPATARRHWTDAKIERGRYSMSLFVWYFGTNRRYETVDHHTILLGPRYRGLVHDIFKRHILPEDFSLYLHRPTATDPSLAPPGCDTFYVLSPVPNLKSDVDWQTAAEPYRRSIADFLGRTLLPGLDEAVVASHMLTPQGFQDRLWSFRGAAFALEPVLMQSAWFRPHNESEDIRHLYLVGAGTHPGGGVPGVLSSARVLDTVVPDAVAFA